MSPDRRTGPAGGRFGTESLPSSTVEPSVPQLVDMTTRIDLVALADGESS